MANGDCKDQIVCEYFDERTGLGHMERLSLDEQGQVCDRTRLAVGAGKHASSPLTMQFEGCWYGMAETSANREWVLHRILTRTPTACAEVPVQHLDPDPNGPFADGLHTVSAWGQRTLLDGKRHVFSPVTVWRKLGRRFQARHQGKALAMVKAQS